MQGDHPVKAYRNLDFLTSPPARTLRILAEYEEPRQRFRQHNVVDTIVFFGSTRARSQGDGEDSREGGGGDQAGAKRLGRYYDEARELASKITVWSHGNRPAQRQLIVTTGGGPGIMEAANRGALEAKGLSIGLGISLPFENGLNPYVSPELSFEFHYFFMRKYWFAYLAKAVVAFPGGLGTLDEVLEVLTLVQTQKITKRLPVVLYGESFWTNMLRVDELERWGTISPSDKDLFHVSDDVDDAFNYITRELG